MEIGLLDYGKNLRSRHLTRTLLDDVILAYYTYDDFVCNHRLTSMVFDYCLGLP